MKNLIPLQKLVLFRSICCAVLIVMSCAVQTKSQDEVMFPVRENGKMGFADKTGKVVVPYQFDLVSKTFSEGLAAVKVGNKWGYIDRSGKFVIPPRFKQEFMPSLFYEGLAQVLIKETITEKSGELDKSQKYFISEEVLGFIDRSGEFVESLKFIEERTVFREGVAKVSIGDKFGYVDKSGKFVIEAKFRYAEDFHEDLAAASFDGFTYNFIDKTGKFVFPSGFAGAESFSEGLAAVMMTDNKWGFVDKKGKLVIEAKFDRVFAFSEGLAKVGNGDKAGFIDKTGKMVIPTKFHSKEFGNITSSETGFREGLAVVEINGKYGYIDKTGKLVIPAKYGYAHDFNGGLAFIVVDRTTGYFIDRTGKKWGIKKCFAADVDTPLKLNRIIKLAYARNV